MVSRVVDGSNNSVWFKKVAKVIAFVIWSGGGQFVHTCIARHF